MRENLYKVFRLEYTVFARIFDYIYLAVYGHVDLATAVSHEESTWEYNQYLPCHLDDSVIYLDVC